jgi:hypothetical protein
VNPWLRGIALGVEVPLGILSFSLYRAVRALVTWRVGARVPTDLRWQVLDREFLQRPVNLLAVMARGPRWNTHALIATSGVVRIEDPFTVDVAAAANSAEQWSLEVRSLNRAMAWVIGTLSVAAGDREATIKTEPGLYTLVMRYYGVRSGAVLPQVRFFPDRLMPSMIVPADALTGYESIRGRLPWLFFALQAYVYPLLCLRRWLPERFVALEFLPVGNPETSFRFGPVERGESLAISVPDSLFETHMVFFTAYNRASFPTLWARVESPMTQVLCPAQGFWLLRIQPRGSAAAADANLKAIRISRLGTGTPAERC